MIVSIITPVYNGEKYIHRLLDSVLIQSYPNIEMIVVDDGSTDATKNIIKSYDSSFKEKGYILKYIYQENQGQAEAINKGLGQYTGDYLTWPDSDDFFSSPDSIATMVNELNQSEENVSMLRTYANVIFEQDLSFIKLVEYARGEHLLDECIFEKNFNLVPGKFLVKSKILRDELVNNQIYPHKAGQNWQILVPLLYRYKCITIKKPLFSIVARDDSHSRKDENVFAVQIQKCKDHKDILIETVNRLKSMSYDRKECLIKAIEIKYAKRKMNLCFSHKNKDLFFQEYNKINKRELSLKDKVKSVILTLLK